LIRINRRKRAGGTMESMTTKRPPAMPAPEALSEAQAARLEQRLALLVLHLEGTAGTAAREVFGEDAELTSDLGPTGDAGIATTELARDLAALGSAREALAQARAALARLHSGSYGRCEACDMPIGTERLDAQPAATRCIACQRAEEERAARHR
jgi:RNA polymerase-binding transcription factor DksA